MHGLSERADPRPCLLGCVASWEYSGWLATAW